MFINFILTVFLPVVSLNMTLIIVTVVVICLSILQATDLFYFIYLFILSQFIGFKPCFFVDILSQC